MNKFDTLVNQILGEGLGANLKAMGKTALKAPFRAAGYTASKALNPAAIARGAAAAVGAVSKIAQAPGKALDMADQMVSKGTIAPLAGAAAGAVQGGLQKLGGTLSKVGTAVAGQYQKQKQDDLRGGFADPDLPSGTVSFDIATMKTNAATGKANIGLPPRANNVSQLKPNDIFTDIDKRSGRSSIYKVVKKTTDNRSLLAVPITFKGTP